VREAINYAINRQALVKVAFAGLCDTGHRRCAAVIAYAQSYQPWPYDPAKARELLKEAGYPNGFSTTLWSSHNHSTAQKVLQFTQQQLAQVGIKAQVTAMDAGQRAAEVEGKGRKRAARMFYRLVGLDRRSRLGAVAAVCLAELAANPVQHRVLQQSAGG
jgi:glutathione transport system substrate-binding protein